MLNMMDDLISRQAAIDALARMMPRSYTPDGSHPADEEIFRVQEVFADCIEALEILPSAQPATNCSEFPNNSDAISRQAAIDTLDRRFDSIPMEQTTEICLLRKDLRELPSVQPEPHWIPCSERLPFAECGESNNVLATCGYRGGEDTSIRWIRTLYFDGGCWCYPTGETYDQKVYAWMPLPEPYRGGDE